jgi:hypothetical protein
LGHGGYVDEQTGELIAPPAIVTPKNELVKAVQEVEEGKFIPDRERDVLTKALGNAEHTRRTRGLGPNYPWSIGFAEDVDSYRKRERGKKQKEEEEKELIKKLEEKYDGMFMSMQKQIHELRQTQAGPSHQLQLEGPAFDSNDGTSQRRSSVASTGIGADEAPMGRYPVDEIKGKTHCELYQSMKNISMKVAVGYALPCEPGVTWHCHQIPDSYARVGVDEVLRGYDSLELDMAGPEDEATLGEILGGVILWKKKDIKLPGLAPPPLPPPLSRRRSPSPPSPPRDYDDHHNGSPSRSPPSGQPSSPSLAPTKPSSPPLAPTKPSAPPLAPTKLQGQKRKKRTTTPGTQSLGTREEPLPKKPTSEDVYWAKSMLNHPPQYILNAPDDYTRTLKK